jgi:hypothetical protein
MTPPEVSDFFSICIVNLSKLNPDIDLTSFLEHREPPDYYIFFSQNKVDPEINRQIPREYRTKFIYGSKYLIATLVINPHHYLPEVQYGLIKFTDRISGIIISIRDISILFINLENADSTELSKVYDALKKLYVSQFGINMICLSSNRKIDQNFEGWRFSNPKLDYCVNEKLNFYILINKVYERVFEEFVNKAHVGNLGIYGVTMRIPYINPGIINYLEQCYTDSPPA